MLKNTKNSKPNPNPIKISDSDSEDNEMSLRSSLTQTENKLKELSEKTIKKDLEILNTKVLLEQEKEISDMYREEILKLERENLDLKQKILELKEINESNNNNELKNKHLLLKEEFDKATEEITEEKKRVFEKLEKIEAEKQNLIEFYEEKLKKAENLYEESKINLRNLNKNIEECDLVDYDCILDIEKFSDIKEKG